MACCPSAVEGDARPEWSRSGAIEGEEENGEVAARADVVLVAAVSSCWRLVVRKLSSGVKVATAVAAVATSMILVVIARYDAEDDLPPGKDLGPSRITHHVETRATIGAERPTDMTRDSYTRSRDKSYTPPK
jgi:hypothetical protein